MFIIVKHTQVFDLNCCLLCNRTYREPLDVSVVRVEFNKRKQPQRKKELTIKLDQNKLYIGKRTKIAGTPYDIENTIVLTNLIKLLHKNLPCNLTAVLTLDI